MQQVDGIGAVAVILIASFAVERITKGALFLLSFAEPWRRAFPGPASVEDDRERLTAEKKQKLLYFYFVVASVLALVVLAGFGSLRIFSRLGFAMNWLLDLVITGLIVVLTRRCSTARRPVGLDVSPSTPLYLSLFAASRARRTPTCPRETAARMALAAS